MTKDSHATRVWAVRHGRRTLEFSRDTLDARRLALARVAELEREADVDEIAMREHMVSADEFDERTVARRTLRWVRRGGRWRRLPDANAGTHRRAR